MNVDKPKTYQARPYYNIFEVLDYVDQTIPGFEKKIWEKLCDMGYIDNNTTTSIYFKGLISEDTSEEVVDGINYMFNEFPDIKNGEVDFYISW